MPVLEFIPHFYSVVLFYNFGEYALFDVISILNKTSPLKLSTTVSSCFVFGKVLCTISYKIIGLTCRAGFGHIPQEKYVWLKQELYKSWHWPETVCIPLQQYYVRSVVYRFNILLKCECYRDDSHYTWMIYRQLHHICKKHSCPHLQFRRVLVDNTCILH